MRRLCGAVLAIACALGLSSCHSSSATAANGAGAPASVGTTPVVERTMSQQLTISSELVPFQEIDVYAKESGFVKQLLVDYGSRVRQGQLMAVLEIPELEAQLQERKAAITAQADEVTRAHDEISRAQAQHEMQRLRYERLAAVAKSQPGMVAQQEVDDAQGRALASESQVDAAKGSYEAARSQLAVANAQLAHDQALFAYARITAPFDGVVTQRYANLGALMQAGTSSNQATPLVRLSEESQYRLVIPVPESDVRYIKLGDPVEVRIPSLGRSFDGKVARFSVDVTSSTRTMHTEVDVPNPSRQLVPGLYADAIVTLRRKPNALALPLQAIDQAGAESTVLVVNPDNRIDRRAVTLGMETANYAEILSGLRAGEQVVSSDRGGLEPGQSVVPHPVPPVVYNPAASSQ